MKKIFFLFGTRPEAIKLAPLIKILKESSAHFDTRVCITSQHKKMLEQVLHFFDIVPDIDLDVMKPSQSLSEMSAIILKELQIVLVNEKPDLVIVQGDTTTAFIGALASYYNQIPIVHVEAGLRTFDKYSPFPEELNRKFIGSIASYHFCPTIKAEKNLYAEGIHENVYMVGNTVVDALLLAKEIISAKGNVMEKSFFEKIDFSKKILLVTGHRRESFGDGFEDICMALKILAEENKDLQIVYPVHLNPNVQEPVNRVLSNIDNIQLLPPLNYENLIWLMGKSYIILTDSGGIQEEAPSLGIPVCVMRTVTERTEGIDAGSAILVGTNTENIVMNVNKLLVNKGQYDRMSQAGNPYGDGKASFKICEILKEKMFVS
jgi:UDP-N-acetylglucosamine 2-epimerase (non-hydrolysing)